jgi:hypothetical protein
LFSFETGVVYLHLRETQFALVVVVVFFHYVRIKPQTFVSQRSKYLLVLRVVFKFRLHSVVLFVDRPVVS